MKMAKDQSLYLNPVKYSGVCGKLMCCLRYEYEEEGVPRPPRIPQIGEIVRTPSGQGKVIDMNLKTQIALVELIVNGEELEFPAARFDDRKGGEVLGLPGLQRR